MPSDNLVRKKNRFGKGSGAKHSVLVVDDEPTLVDIYSTSFREAGWTVYSAENGEEGLKAAEANRPDIILLDLIMPIKDGFETLRGLKAGAKTKDIPVVILSNLGQDFEVNLGLSLGAVEFLVKASIEPSGLVEEAKKVLEGKVKRANGRS